jgi:hypothetical protein
LKQSSWRGLLLCKHELSATTQRLGNLQQATRRQTSAHLLLAAGGGDGTVWTGHANGAIFVHKGDSFNSSRCILCILNSLQLHVLVLLLVD